MSTPVISAVIAAVSVAIAVTAFFASTRATRLRAESDDRAVDAAAYTRATGIYESTIKALREEIARLTSEIAAARAEIREVRIALDQLQDTNDALDTELAHLRSAERAELEQRRQRDADRLTAYDDPDQPDPRPETGP